MPPKRAAKAAPPAPTRNQPKRAASGPKSVDKSEPAPDKPARKPAQKPAQEPIQKSAQKPAKKSAGRKRKASPQDEDGTSENEPKARKVKAAAPENVAPTGPQKSVPKKSAGTLKKAPAERDETERCYWLMKAEPESRLEKGVDVAFSIDDLEAGQEPEAWDGVRNAVAQKNMRNMRKGELAFFYHSNCKVPGIAGVMKIVNEHSVDRAAFIPKHPYYDPKSDPDKPRWVAVDVEFVKKFDEFVPLKKLQEYAKVDEPLETLQTLKLSRLSVSQVKLEEWHFILGLAGEDGEEIEKLARIGRFP